MTHSSGNHAQALARAAREAGIRATVVMPRETPDVKRLATLRHGAKVELVRALRAGLPGRGDRGRDRGGVRVALRQPRHHRGPGHGGPGDRRGRAGAQLGLGAGERWRADQWDRSSDQGDGSARAGHRCGTGARRRLGGRVRRRPSRHLGSGSNGAHHCRRASRPGGRRAELGPHHGVRRRGRDGQRGGDQGRPAADRPRLQARVRAQRCRQRGRLPEHHAVGGHGPAVAVVSGGNIEARALAELLAGEPGREAAPA